MKISEKKGIIPPLSDMSLDIFVEANRPGELAHPVKIFCEGQSQPLLVHVKAIALAMTVEVKMEDLTGRLIGVGENFINHLEFGPTEVKSRSVRSVTILNLSAHAIEYNWNPVKRKNFKIEPETEIIPARGSSKCLVTYSPNKLESSIDLKERWPDYEI